MYRIITFFAAMPVTSIFALLSIIQRNIKRKKILIFLAILFLTFQILSVLILIFLLKLV